MLKVSHYLFLGVEVIPVVSSLDLISGISMCSTIEINKLKVTAAEFIAIHENLNTNSDIYFSAVSN